jgi:hypothetical protein
MLNKSPINMGMRVNSAKVLDEGLRMGEEGVR